MKQFFISKAFKRARTLTLSCFLFFIVVGVFIGLWYGTPSTPIERANAPECCNVTLGDRFYLGDVISQSKYKPLWLAREGVTVSVSVDGLTAQESDSMLTFEKDAKRFTATGIGQGKITFTSPVDKSVSFTVPFNVSYKSKDTADILAADYAELIKDNKLTSDEIASVTYVTIGSATADTADLAEFSNLRTVNLTCLNGIPTVTNMKPVGAWEYFVPVDEYKEIIANTNWASYKNYIFPDTDKSDDCFEIVFDSNGGGFKSTSAFDSAASKKGLFVLEVKSGEKIDVSKYEPVKTGFTFDGWTVDGDGRVGEQSKLPKGEYEVKDNVKVHAEWKEHEYGVEFDMNGGSGSVAAKRLKYSESYNPSIASVKREGYDFMGWSMTPNGAVVIAAGEPVVSLTDKDTKESLTLYAVWRADVYNVKFIDGGEILQTKNNVGYFDNVTIYNYKPAARQGESFLGWSLDPSATTPTYQNNNVVSKLSAVYGDTVEIYAVWDANRYTVYYDANGGTGAPSAQTVRYGDYGYIPAATPTQYGFAFEGWAKTSYASRSSHKPGDQYLNLCTENGAKYTFYAVWEPDQFKITFNNNGATSGSADTKTVEFGESFDIIIKSFKKTGYAISGWSLNSGSTSPDYRADILTKAEVKDLYDMAQNYSGKRVDLYPIWKELVYNVEYDLEGGTGASDLSNLKYNQTFSLPNPTRDYYRFTGWICDFDDAEYSAGKVLSGSAFEGIGLNDDVVFKATWELSHCDVKFDLNGGSGSVSNKTKHPIGNSLTLPSKPTKDGYNFKGWKCSTNNETYGAGSSWSGSTTKKTVTFTAQWEKIEAAQ